MRNQIQIPNVNEPQGLETPLGLHKGKLITILFSSFSHKVT